MDKGYFITILYLIIIALTNKAKMSFLIDMMNSIAIMILKQKAIMIH